MMNMIMSAACQYSRITIVHFKFMLSFKDRKSLPKSQKQKHDVCVIIF